MKSLADAATATGTRRSNPYVGPRALREGEAFYARDTEMQELADLLIAQRIVLLHAPSGAGKTSLIQAGLTPLLRDDGFALTPALRVNSPEPNGNGGVANRYVYSVAFSLLGAERTPDELARVGLPDVLREARARDPDRVPVLVIDQFEEILLLDPTDRDNQRAFFKELGEALAADEAWALFSIREDYLGGLDRFLRYIPGHLAARYRLDFLDHRGAAEAIQLPARDYEVEFEDDAATWLVKQLATVKIQSPEGRGEISREAPYVQPFQLQVVCNALWRSISKANSHRNGLRQIKLKDVRKHADVGSTLQNYYRGVVRWVAEETGAEERVIRRWFETELITQQGFRRQTLTGPGCEGVDPSVVLQELERAYLIRSDSSRESTWYELSHDQLIRPILVDNENWEKPRLAPWQLLAREWEDNRDPDRLIQGWDLHMARRAVNEDELTHVERTFLDASEHAERERGLINFIRTRLVVLYAVIAVETLAIIGLLIALVL